MGNEHLKLRLVQMSADGESWWKVARGEENS
jgi:hypothetical protein